MKFCPICKCDLANKWIDGVDRLACVSSECSFVFWGNPVPVVAAIVMHQGKCVMARNAAWPVGMFSVITGFLERGESPDDAILRETQEELGLTVQSSVFIGHFPFVKFNQLILAYAVECTGALKLNEEIAEVQLLTRGELESFDFGPLELTKSIVQRWLSGQRFTQVIS
jgi:NAD+ diphosphatase